MRGGEIDVRWVDCCGGLGGHGMGGGRVEEVGGGRWQIESERRWQGSCCWDRVRLSSVC